MKTVMVFGTFDLMHMGHIHMLKEASKYGDKLFVIVARDKNVKKVKNKKPLHDEDERLKFLQELRVVDEVRLGNKNDQFKIVKQVEPNVIALGYDQKVDLGELEEKITEFGLNTEIVRLKPYGESRFKSGKLRGYLEKMI